MGDSQRSAGHLDGGEHRVLARTPRWIEIPASVFLGAISLVCLAWSILILAGGAERSRLLLIAIGSAMLLVSAWCIVKSVQLVTGREVRGGLLSPTALRVSAVLFLFLPVGGLFTGYYAENGPIAIVQALSYVVTSGALVRIAAARAARLRSGGGAR